MKKQYSIKLTKEIPFLNNGNESIKLTMWLAVFRVYEDFSDLIDIGYYIDDIEFADTVDSEMVYVDIYLENNDEGEQSIKEVIKFIEYKVEKYMKMKDKINHICKKAM